MELFLLGKLFCRDSWIPRGPGRFFVGVDKSRHFYFGGGGDIFPGAVVKLLNVKTTEEKNGVFKFSGFYRPGESFSGVENHRMVLGAASRLPRG